jgi:hypothetical protein
VQIRARRRLRPAVTRTIVVSRSAHDKEGEMEPFQPLEMPEPQPPESEDNDDVVVSDDA